MRHPSGRDPGSERGSLAIFYLLLGLTAAGVLVAVYALWP
jgi:hypothetical protein